MKHLLENEFIAHYNMNQSKKTHTIQHISTTDKEFGLTDTEEKPLSLCIISDAHAIYENPTEKVIHILGYDRFIGSFQKEHRFGKRCDGILYDEVNGHVVFNELTTCMKEDSLDKPCDKKNDSGKRAKAYEQLRNSINVVIAVKEICTFLSCYKKKVALFSYRSFDPSPKAVKNEATESMEEFGKPASLNNNMSFPNEDWPAGFRPEIRIFPTPYSFSAI